MKKRSPRGGCVDFYNDVVLTYDGNECLIWPFSVSGKGYVQLKYDGRVQYVSRLICERLYGPRPSPDHVATYSCGNGDKGCVAKGHLRWATRAEAEAGKLVRGTHSRGSTRAIRTGSSG